MSKVKAGIDAVRFFVGDVITEVKKSTWPSRQELFESTIVVIVSVMLLSLFVGVSDKLLITMLRLLIPSSGN